MALCFDGLRLTRQPGLNCPSFLVQVFLAVLARHYDFAVDMTDEYDKSLVPHPANRLPIYVTKRSAGGTSTMLPATALQRGLLEQRRT